MLSNFGRADGGRETWAYNFIPRLLERYPDLRLNIYGLRVDGEPDNRETVLSSVPRAQRGRLSVEFVRSKADRWPNALAYWNGVSKLSRDKPPPAFVLAVGSWVELRAALLTPAFRPAGKLVWLRSIFADEKAHRYPAALRPWLKRIERAVLKRADVIIANGEDTAEHYRKFGLKVQVIPNGVDLDRWRVDPPPLEGPLNVAYVGRLAPVKGIDDFLEVARRAKERGLDWLEFHVIGEGPRVPSEGLVHYHGPVPNEEMPRLLSKMHACVALTYVRGSGDRFSGGAGVSNALLEQMAASRVMIAWDNAAFRQVLDESSAYLIQQGDQAALLDALERMHSNPAEAKEYAANAAVVAQGYSFDQHLDRFQSAAAKWLTAAKAR